MSTDYDCPLCHQEVGTYPTAGGKKINQHDNIDGRLCPMSNEKVPR